MKGIYTINFKLVVDRVLPPNKRGDVMKAWLYSLVSPVQWLRDLLFDSFYAGSTDQNYDNSTAYAKYDRVIYTDKALYECIAPTTGNLPTDTNYWIKVQDVWIGFMERSRYNAQRILFEYSLNKWFNVTLAPYIYIQNVPFYGTQFCAFETEPLSSAVYTIESATKDYVFSTYSVSIRYNFTIYVPAAVYAAVGESAIRQQANKYNVYGMTYNVLSY